jgi:putative ABC transport system substrate-binding protein
VGAELNNRRKLVIALGTSTLVAPFASFAQSQGKVWRIGWLASRTRPTPLDSYGPGRAFLQGIRDLGYVEGKNLEIEWRFAESNYERLPDLAAELVQLKVDVFVTGGIQASSAAKKATTTTPIVMVNVADPVGSGLVHSLARPAGNITGLTNISRELAPKHLEMLLSVAPKLSNVAFLVNPTNSFYATVLEHVRTAGRHLGVNVLPVEARTLQEIENAFSMMRRQNAGAVMVQSDPFLIQQYGQIAGLAVKNRLPSISGFGEYAEAGGLISYGQNNADIFRSAATYVDKIFKGAKPGDLPVEQPTKFELLINGKTAKALGLKIPKSLLVMADKVIE